MEIVTPLELIYMKVRWMMREREKENERECEVSCFLFLWEREGKREWERVRS